MSDKTKSVWLSIILSGTIVAGLGVAYAAGIKNSNVDAEIKRVDERVGDVEEDFEVCKIDFERHQVKNEQDMEGINSHLHRIDILMTEQTQILKRIERND
jgi:hypothetical protein